MRPHFFCAIMILTVLGLPSPGGPRAEETALRVIRKSCISDSLRAEIEGLRSPVTLAFGVGGKDGLRTPRLTVAEDWNIESARNGGPYAAHDARLISFMEVLEKEHETRSAKIKQTIDELEASHRAAPEEIKALHNELYDSGLMLRAEGMWVVEVWKHGWKGFHVLDLDVDALSKKLVKLEARKMDLETELIRLAQDGHPEDARIVQGGGAQQALERKTLREIAEIEKEQLQGLTVAVLAGFLDRADKPLRWMAGATLKCGAIGCAVVAVVSHAVGLPIDLPTLTMGGAMGVGVSSLKNIIGAAMDDRLTAGHQKAALAEGGRVLKRLRKDIRSDLKALQLKAPDPKQLSEAVQKVLAGPKEPLALPPGSEGSVK
jgi:hypothetical protein